MAFLIVRVVHIARHTVAHQPEKFVVEIELREAVERSGSRPDLSFVAIKIVNRQPVLRFDVQKIFAARTQKEYNGQRYETFEFIFHWKTLFE